jgi:hypothetical protein
MPTKLNPQIQTSSPIQEYDDIDLLIETTKAKNKEKGSHTLDFNNVTFVIKQGTVTKELTLH